MKLESKFWIEKNGEKVFGEGPCLLLEEVNKSGSLNKAAIKLNMSYSKAWTIINRAENILGYPLLERRIGGVDGGGSYLTSNGRILVENYQNFCQEADKALEELQKKYLKEI